MDAEGGALGVALERQLAPGQLGGDGLDQRRHRLLQPGLVELAIGLEPGLVVVRGQAAQEVEGGRREPGRLGH